MGYFGRGCGWASDFQHQNLEPQPQCGWASDFQPQTLEAQHEIRIHGGVGWGGLGWVGVGWGGVGWGSLSAEGAIGELARRLQKHEPAETRMFHSRQGQVRVDGNNPQG